MIDIAGSELNKYYGSNHVLQGITFEIYSGERIGLLGKNGSGKTTLFKLLTGEEFYESGSIFKASSMTIGMLSQLPVYDETDTVEDVLRSSFQEITRVYTAMNKIAGDANPKVLARYGRLMEEYERLGGYETEVVLDKICNGMHINSAMRKSRFNLLSGGEKTRVNLGRILLLDCDILLLDEPTNHLDLQSIAWLENFLRRFPGTVLVISHDRVFLDAVITRVMEIENGKMNFYQGNYSQYVAEKQQRRQTQAAQYTKQQRKIKQLDEAVKRLHAWGRQGDNEALHQQADAIEKRIERMDKVEKPTVASVMTAGFHRSGYAAKVLASLEDVSKRYGENTLLRHANISISRQDRIALIGANGCGKTTLLKILTGEETADSGTVKVSANSKPAYMPQTITFANPDATALETLCLATGFSEPRVRAILAKFQFRADDVLKKAGTLSGGERSRLKLCLMMQNGTNFLLLDEPTNHLDITTREWIEHTLEDFSGAMLLVSHDRYLLKKFAKTIWHMSNGEITAYNCGYDEYTERLADNQSEPNGKKQRNKSSIGAHKNTPDPALQTEKRIADAEAELAHLNAEIASDAAHSDYEKLQILYEAKNKLEQEIEALYSLWAENGL